MLIAAIRSGSPLAGKAISCSEDDGKFWLTGVGEISPARLLEYEQNGVLEWANDETRAWALQQAGVPEDASAAAVPAPRVPGERTPALAAATAQLAPEPQGPLPPPPAEPPALAGGEGPAAVPAPPRRAEYPGSGSGEQRRKRFSGVQWRTIAYAAVGLAMIAALVIASLLR